MKLVLRLIFFVGAYLISNTAFSQLNKANYHYEAYAYQKAIPKYEKYLKKKPYDPEALFRLANSYRLTGEVKQAERWFEKAVQYYNEPVAKFYYALVLMTNNNYQEAERWFRNYAMAAPSQKDAANARNLADYAAKLHQHGVNYKPFEVFKTGFNSEELDFSPMYFQDTLLVFASNRKHEVRKHNNKDNWTNANFMDLYKVRVFENNNYGEPELLASELKSKFHESSAVFTSTYDTMYFTRSDYLEGEGRGYDKFSNTRLKIFMSMEAVGEWGKAIELPFNSNQFSTCHPTLTSDGRTMVFASDRPGGYGHMDLYVTHLENGEWTEPQNLGSEINTAGNEIFPYIHESGNLYYSSDGQAGLGGLDIFTSPVNGKMWGFPVNLGAPLNSTRDDFGIIADRGFSKGYFSSNRDGKDDIYTFSKGNTIMLEGVVIICQEGEPIEGANVVLYEGESDSLADRNTSIDGYFTFEVQAGKRYRVVATKNGFGPCNDCPGEAYVTIPMETEENFVRVELPMCSGAAGTPLVSSRSMGAGLNICGTVINEAYDRPMPNTKVVVTNLCTGDEQVIITDASGNFYSPVEKGCDYVIEGHKNKFSGRMVGLSTMTDSTAGDCFPVEVPLSFNRDLLPPELSGKVPIYAGMVIELYNIYFDLDKYFIRSDATSDLEELYALLIKYPDMKGELSAHTDSRATHEYNITLSENRAKSAFNYLVRKGIDPARLTWKGYGETRLKNECADGVECTEKQHQRNRRVEFTVTYFNGTVISKEYDYFKRDNSGKK
ncbi:OmpA family protein [Flammeovirgaceae bacterium SG7u.111]|nr:OmpA family protein [Flammeovirgaceae bacterium SG7u.132]WPO36682.1 OmpA family protein [Flammeovirgaceae bacterium SG7u.111]